MLFRIVASISMDGCSLTTDSRGVPLLTDWARICCSTWLARTAATLIVDRTSATLRGRGAFETASTFSGDVWRPWLSISCPQKAVFSLKNSHFALSARKPWTCKRRKTLARCSSSFFPVTIMSLRIQFVADVPSKTWSMLRCQTAGAEVMPNTSRLYWNSSIWVLIVRYFFETSSISNWW